jgi:hypothetical protein
MLWLRGALRCHIRSAQHCDVDRAAASPRRGCAHVLHNAANDHVHRRRARKRHIPVLRSRDPTRRHTLHRHAPRSLHPRSAPSSVGPTARPSWVGGRGSGDGGRGTGVGGRGSGVGGRGSGVGGRGSCRLVAAIGAQARPPTRRSREVGMRTPRAAPTLPV